MIDKRINYRYGGDTMGGPNDKSNDQGETSSDSGFSNNTSKNTSKNTSTDTSDYNYKGPADLGVSTRTVNRITGPEAYEIIGGKKYDVTPNTKSERERARVMQSILNPTIKKNKVFDPISNNFISPFVPKPKKKFGILDLIMIGASGGLLGPKIATGAKMFNTANTISKFAQDIGLTDKNVVDSFTSNFTEKFDKGKKSTTKTLINKNNSDDSGGKDGLSSLENMDALNEEYLLLLNKFNTGVFTDADQVRFTFLQKILGK